MSSAIQPLAFPQVAEPAISVGTYGSARPPLEVAPAEPATTRPVLLNPSLRIENGLGLVVMEFYDEAGAVTSSIPTARQLDAYRYSDGRSTAATTPAAGKASGGAATSEAGQAAAQVASATPATRGASAASSTVAASFTIAASSTVAASSTIAQVIA